MVCPDKESARSWKQIRSLIAGSRLHPAAKKIGVNIFSRLAEAEGKIHGIAPEKVHFHEVGATDSIVDIMAAAIGVHELGIDAFHFSRIPLGRGLTRALHGPLPIPGPATLELLKDLPVEGIDLESETVTPTGAAIVQYLGQEFRRATQHEHGKDRLWRGTERLSQSAEPFPSDHRHGLGSLEARRDARNGN